MQQKLPIRFVNSVKSKTAGRERARTARRAGPGRGAGAFTARRDKFVPSYERVRNWGRSRAAFREVICGLKNSRGGAGVSKTEQETSGGRRRSRRTKKQLIAEVIGSIEQRIDQNELKPTVGDFIRLLQLEREIEQEEPPKEIKVSWVEPEEETKDAASGE